MFSEQFEKVAYVGSAAIGALGGTALGGEDDHEKGGRKNRSVGALRGAGLMIGAKAGSHAGNIIGLMSSGKKGKKLYRKALKHGKATMIMDKGEAQKIVSRMGAGGLAGTAVGGYGGYKITKELAPKYDRENKRGH